jgi:hypothetical protein
MMIQSTIRQALRIALPLAGVVSLAACGASSDLTGTARQPVSFSFTTRSVAATGSVSSPELRNDLVLGANGELVLTKIQLVANRLELTRNDATACVSNDSASDDKDKTEREHENESEACEDVSRDPLVLDIPVDAAVHTAVNVPLSAGTYTKLEARLAPAKALDATNPSLKGASILVTGTFNGKAFTFTSAMRNKIEMEFNPPLVVDATTQNATINIDVSTWFKSASGGVIDPSTANTGGANAARVAANIGASFKAFEDDDRGGDDDHGHHGGSSGH